MQQLVGRRDQQRLERLVQRHTRHPIRVRSTEHFDKHAVHVFHQPQRSHHEHAKVRRLNKLGVFECLKDREHVQANVVGRSLSLGSQILLLLCDLSWCTHTANVLGTVDTKGPGTGVPLRSVGGEYVDIDAKVCREEPTKHIASNLYRRFGIRGRWLGRRSRKHQEPELPSTWCPFPPSSAFRIGASLSHVDKLVMGLVIFVREARVTIRLWMKLGNCGMEDVGTVPRANCRRLRCIHQS
ncbi:hypothetical protein H257_17307 [Aphanomyces astaci]|uniref:Uncharacterized protein n=1 Tax=Aphanomyces astaci TaxID=112090 RepID=W4FFD7_APHAT|nr:hypothetical protein H257_17307 [Aphanomyces astaci]ETV66155.1 hypothetical protein H257_17307 [Aphanomyces astaci]|eukprot:XP_009844344.1 hypothetical protein H257_17307 [Aphanomyces astaci]